MNSAFHEPPRFSPVQPFVAYATKGCSAGFTVSMRFEDEFATPEPGRQGTLREVRA
jgi:hypothetical protein